MVDPDGVFLFLHTHPNEAMARSDYDVVKRSPRGPWLSSAATCGAACHERISRSSMTSSTTARRPW